MKLIIKMFKEKSEDDKFYDSLKIFKKYRLEDINFRFLDYPPLNIAARYGDIELVKKFIDKNVNIEFNNRCVITEALYSENSEVIGEILKTGTLSRKSIDSGFGYFINNCKLNNFELFLSYLNDKNILENLENIFSKDRLDMIDIIIDYKDTSDNILKKILEIACEKNISDLVSKITNKGIFSEEAFLTCAKSKKSSNILKHFLIFEEFKNHIFYFVLTCFNHNNYKCFKIISEYLTPDLRNDYGTPLLFKVFNNYCSHVFTDLHSKKEKMLSLLLQKLNINIKHERKCLMTILVKEMPITESEIYTRNFRKIMEKIFLKFDFSEEGVDRYGNNPLMRCFEDWKFYLYNDLKNLYNPQKLNDKGENFINIIVEKLKYAGTRENLEKYCDFLINIINEEDFNINIIDSKGNNPLMIILKEGRTGIARRILHKFDLDFTNKIGEKALTIFLQKNSRPEYFKHFNEFSDLLENLIERTDFDLVTQKYLTKYILQNLYDKNMNICPIIELISKFPEKIEKFENFEFIKKIIKNFKDF